MALVTHGGRARAFARENGIDVAEVLDFSASINPLGPSARVLQAIHDAIGVVQFYPDEFAECLVARLSERSGVPAQHILAGNGATDLLYYWIRTVRPRRATLVVPTFTEYRRALESIGSEIKVDSRSLPVIHPDVDAVFLTNPNNPTGAFLPVEEMRDWLRGVPANVHVFIDEAFVEFTRQPSIVRYVDEFPNLWVLRSLTKFYAIPGLRLGYLVGRGVEDLSRYREPWQVNALAEAAGLACLLDPDHEERTHQVIQQERIWMWKQLRSLRTLDVLFTQANFFLARCAGDHALEQLISDFGRHRILVRDCRGLEGIEGSAFRFGIRNRDENQRLLDCLRRA